MEGCHISYFARSNHRCPFRPVGIKQDDRLSHLYVIGKTGVGKTTLLETMITQDTVPINAVTAPTDEPKAIDACECSTVADLLKRYRDTVAIHHRGYGSENARIKVFLHITGSLMSVMMNRRMTSGDISK